MSNEEKALTRSSFNTGGAVAAFRPSNLDEYVTLAKMFAESGDMVPKSYAGSIPRILVAMQAGAEVGLSPFAAIQNIAVINGKPSVYGDAVIALARTHPKWDESGFEELFEGQPFTDEFCAICRVKRTDGSVREKRFSVLDAKTASLWGKAGPWKQYPKRMLQMRARSWAIRDNFAEALAGLSVAEEIQDIPSEEAPASAPAVEYPTEVGPTSKTEATREKLRRKVEEKARETEVEAEVVEETPKHTPANTEGPGSHPDTLFESEEVNAAEG